MLPAMLSARPRFLTTLRDNNRSFESVAAFGFYAFGFAPSLEFRREIEIRTAVGAQRSDVLVLWGGLLLA